MNYIVISKYVRTEKPPDITILLALSLHWALFLWRSAEERIELHELNNLN